MDGMRAGTQNAGICLTFDDWFVRGWHGAMDLFDRYNAKATFFLGKPDKIRSNGWRRLRELQDAGHEIGCHTMTHARLTKFLATHDLNDYIHFEILPALRIMREEGIDVTSFSYPYFKYRPRLTGLLTEHFRMVREAGVSENPIHAIYPERGNVNVGIMGVLDRTGAEVPLSYYEDRFGLLAAHGGYGYFCGHALGPDVPKNAKMTCSYAHLEEVLHLAKDYGLAMKPMRETGFKRWGPAELSVPVPLYSLGIVKQRTHILA